MVLMVYQGIETPWPDVSQVLPHLTHSLGEWRGRHRRGMEHQHLDLLIRARCLFWRVPQKGRRLLGRFLESTRAFVEAFFGRVRSSEVVFNDGITPF